MNHNDNKILSHSTWNCKYHIVFAPKYRRKIFYESRRKEIMEIIKELCLRCVRLKILHETVDKQRKFLYNES